MRALVIVSSNLALSSAVLSVRTLCFAAPYEFGFKLSTLLSADARALFSRAAGFGPTGGVFSQGVGTLTYGLGSGGLSMAGRTVALDCDLAPEGEGRSTGTKSNVSENPFDELAGGAVRLRAAGPGTGRFDCPAASGALALVGKLCVFPPLAIGGNEAVDGLSDEKYWGRRVARGLRAAWGEEELDDAPATGSVFSISEVNRSVKAFINDDFSDGAVPFLSVQSSGEAT